MVSKRGKKEKQRRGERHDERTGDKKGWGIWVSGCLGNVSEVTNGCRINEEWAGKGEEDESHCVKSLPSVCVAI